MKEPLFSGPKCPDFLRSGLFVQGLDHPLQSKVPVALQDSFADLVPVLFLLDIEADPAAMANIGWNVISGVGGQDLLLTGSDPELEWS